MIQAVLDTSVLFPPTLRDTLLDAAIADLYVPWWSPDILDELRRSLSQDDSVSDEAILRLTTAMTVEFPDAAVEGYQPLIAELRNDPDDRHVLAAAIQAAAEVIVTANLRHFPEHSLAPFGITAQSPGDFLLRLFDSSPNQLEQVIRGQAAAYRKPPMTVDQLLDRLARHAPMFVEHFVAATR